MTFDPLNKFTHLRFIALVRPAKSTKRGALTVLSEDGVHETRLVTTALLEQLAVFDPGLRATVIPAQTTESREMAIEIRRHLSSQFSGSQHEIPMMKCFDLRSWSDERPDASAEVVCSKINFAVNPEDAKKTTALFLVGREQHAKGMLPFLLKKTGKERFMGWLRNNSQGVILAKSDIVVIDLVAEQLYHAMIDRDDE